MPDVAHKPEPEPTPAAIAIEKLSAAADAALANIRTAVTGDPEGRMRRPILFAVIAIAFGFSGTGIVAVIGLVAIILLALTDTVVPL